MFRIMFVTIPNANRDGNAIVELYFDDGAEMEAAWAGPQGAASAADLPKFVDLTRTTWAVVEDVTVLR
jgi:hypothetical protein